MVDPNTDDKLETDGILNDATNTTLDELKTSIKENNNNQSYNQIIYQSFNFDEKNSSKQRSNDGFVTSSVQICDILDDYKWTIDDFTNKNQNFQFDIGKDDKTVKSANFSVCNVPHCYLIQYQQRRSSNITNFVNTLVSAVSAINDSGTEKAITKMASKIDELKNSLMKSVFGSNDSSGTGVKEVTNSIYKSLKSGMNNLADYTVGNIDITNGITNSKYLAPYKLLYDLKETNQRYVFPMVAQPPINKLENTFGEKQDSDSILSSNNMLTWFNKVSQGIVSFTRDLKDLGSLFGGGTTTFQLSHVEKAKFYNYPTKTQEYTITFPLLNTVRSKGVPEWKKNYKFIMLFTLRNMIFRRDNASFFPPLFYDLVIPGVIREPFCYVQNVSIKPLGVVRMLGFKDLFSFIGDGKNYSVAVPEAWIVTIKLKSLLATSANLVLSGLNDLSITTKS